MIYNILLFLIFVSTQYSQNYLSKSKEYKELKAYQRLWIEGDISEAIDELVKTPQSLNDRYNLAFLYWANQDYDKALITINEVIKTKSSDYAYLLKAKIYLSQKQYFIAQKSIEKAYEINDSDYKILTLYGKTLYLNKKYTKAISILEESLDENDKYAETVIYLAKSYEANGNIKKAIDLLTEQLGTTYPELDYLTYLSELFEKSGQVDKAIIYLKKYLDIYPKGKFSNIAVKSLTRLNNSYAPLNPFHDMTKNYKIKANEYLKYVVSYGFNIGQMLINVGQDTVLVDNKKTFYVSYKLKSTTFLIDLVSHFESYIDVNSLNTIRSYLSNSEGGNTDQKLYIFDREKNLFTARIVNYDKRFEFVERDLPLNAQDGTSILYFSRGMVANKLSGTVTTVIAEEFSTTEIITKNTKKESLQDKEDDYYFIEANANYSGVAGMTGEALGFFTIDENYIPAIGKLKIIVGSVRVELTEKSY